MGRWVVELTDQHFHHGAHDHGLVQAQVPDQDFHS